MIMMSYSEKDEMYVGGTSDCSWQEAYIIEGVWDQFFPDKKED